MAPTLMLVDFEHVNPLDDMDKCEVSNAVIFDIPLSGAADKTKFVNACQDAVNQFAADSVLIHLRRRPIVCAAYFIWGEGCKGGDLLYMSEGAFRAQLQLAKLRSQSCKLHVCFKSQEPKDRDQVQDRDD
ncbi:hypothetical protein F5B22DRAFT_648752 [Xylaria bambusicola]|uniref:uncharacterized protein n=1 Tax=Xylaria bambusicola TaxID=326684 RepID=UPI002008CB90|nr:uncharacterized protein F5B22DRAFT_648752 [Xylaria bambusicola]KAI0509731.1 hypothetical protein F5B22DRAFT_648752 [Xylaria bambusicola]